MPLFRAWQPITPSTSTTVLKTVASWVKVHPPTCVAGVYLQGPTHLGQKGLDELPGAAVAVRGVECAG